MAHFAEIENGIVKRIIVVDNIHCKDPAVKTVLTQSTLKIVSGKTVNIGQENIIWESETEGIAYCQKLFGGTWVQTSYNGNTRKKYASIGDTYDKALDAFITKEIEK